MAFPTTQLPVRNQLFIGGQWIDFGDSTLVRDAITMRRGVPDYGVRPDPSSCGLSLRNRSGDLSPRLPTGPYYGLFGRNTPLRVVLDEAADDFNRTSSSGWGTSSSGHTWATSGGLASAYAVSGGSATIAVSAVNSARITALNVSLADCDVTATFKPGVVAAGDEFVGEFIDMALMLRYQDDNNLYYAILRFYEDATVQVLIAQRKSGVSTVLVASSGLGTYTASSQWRIRAKICGRVITVRAWDAVNGTEPSTFDTWVVDNDSDAILTAGKVGCRMFLQPGNTNTLPLTLTASDLEVVHHRYNGEVPVWPVDWDLSGKNVWTPITAAGLLRRVNKAKEEFSPLRRLGQGSFPVPGGVVGGIATNSSYRRAVGYWPLEEDSTTTVASSGLPGGQPMAVSGTIAWSSISTVAGSEPLPDMMDGTGTLVGTIAAPAAPTGAWTVGAIFTPPTLSATWTPLAWTVGGNTTFDRFELRATTSNTFELYGFLAGASSLLTSVPFQDLTARPTFIRVTAMGFEADVDYTINTTINGYDNDYSSASYTATTSTAGYVTQVQVSSVAGGGSDTAGLGHIMVWDGWFTILSDTGIDDALQAYAGEAGHLRLARLFQQDGYAFIYIGDESEPIGPQRSARLPDLVDDVLVVDKGLMYEARDENAVIYLTRRSRYNLTTTLALTYGSSGHVALPFRPVEDDRDVVNDLTIKREGGASGRYEKTSGPLSVNPPEAGGIGRYPQKKTLPLYNDTQPYLHAAWEINVATWDEARYPSVNVNMARVAHSAATVFEQAKRLDVGGRLTVASPPAWLPPDTIDLHALGLVEVISGEGRGAYAWRISAQTVPAGPYSVGVVGTNKPNTGGCELMVNRNSSDTSLTVHTTVLPKWLTGAGLSVPLIVAGERLTATTIANVTPSFVAVGAASHGSNASLTPALPAGLAAGDLLLLLAGIRNSGTGFPLVPTSDWDVLADLGNLCLYGKYAQSGESVPTVNFAAGVANATTSAQCAAWRGVGLTVHKRASQLNVSAQNIAYPALTVVRNNCLVVVFGWKQDDWTSVATLAGMTEVGEPSSITGDDQGVVWDYVLQSTATNIASGSFVVTGGVSAISRGGAIALASDVQTMTVTRSVNTVAKSQTARTPINVYQPLRPGL